jgi:4-hydroxy-4-methyl-2-oxoglutarate aldolase
MQIRAPAPPLDPDLLEGFRGVDPATVGHFLHFGFVDPEIRALWRPIKVAGTAFTIRTTAMDSTMVHRAFEMVRPGDVLVIDRSGDRRHAGFGGVLAYAATLAGVAGVVLDGPATDIREIEEYALPVYARGLSVLTTKVWGTGGDINVPVQVGGVTVQPGDLVFGDDNGVLVLPPDLAPTLLEVALKAEAAERVTKERLLAGASVTDLTGSKRLLERDVMSMLRAIRFGEGAAAHDDDGSS